ncbi:MAG: SDR family oxidoreductase [Armatimonadota bacterium]
MDDKKTKTALITGASSGIGEVFAKKLASLGYNLVLTARRKNLLEKLACRLEAKYSVNAEVLTADLSKLTDIIKLEKQIALMNDLYILINNAGFGTSPGYFYKSNIDKETDMITVHITAMLRLTHAALPKMISHGEGVIINVSSMAGFTPVPKGINYGATKCFMSFFSEGLSAELKGTGVKVQALCPGFTYTGFHDTSEYKSDHRDKIPKILWMNAEDVVNESMEALNKNKVIVIPGFKNRLLKTMKPVIKPIINIKAKAR